MGESEILPVSVCILCSNNIFGGVAGERKEEERVEDENVERSDSPGTNGNDKTVTSGSGLTSECIKGQVGKFVNSVLHKREELEQTEFEILEGLSVCENCLEVIKGVVDKKESADKLEEKVKELQMQVLEEMRKHEVQIEEFYLEMRRIGEIVEKTDFAKLERTWRNGGGVEKRCLEEERLCESFKGGDGGVGGNQIGNEQSEMMVEDGGGKEKSGEVDKDSGGNCDKIRDDVGMRVEVENYFAFVHKLRDSILEAIQELDEKLNGQRSGDNRRKSKRLKKKSRARYTPSEEVMIPFLHCAVKIEGAGESEGTKKTGPQTGALSIPEFAMEQLIKTEPMEDESPSKGTGEEGNFIREKDSTSQSNVVDVNEYDGFEPEVISEVIVDGVGHRGRPRRMSKSFKNNGGKGDHVEGEVLNDDDVVEVLDDDDEDFLKDTSDDDFFLDEGEEDSRSESESSTNSDSEGSSEDLEKDDGEDYGRKKRKKKIKEKSNGRKRERKNDPNSKSSRKTAYTKTLDSINFSGMSKLKRKLIQRVLHKKYRRPTRKPKTPGKEDVADPRLEHFIEYDNLKDLFSLDGIAITVLEGKSEEGDDILTLECSVCGWQAKPAAYSRHPVDSFIYNHIAGQHLNLFQCVQCGSNLGGFKQYSDHVLGHRMGFACDVCGRPLGGAQALARHKWSHLNEEEAAELVAKGLKDPREKKESTKIYPCPTCGKIFPQRCQLKKHEKVHASVRERITCEICGKQFLPSGFISHKRYYCFPEGVDHPRISCPLCPKVFKNKQFMQVHMDRAHNTERNHKCAQCGKGFKTKKDLMTHEETHTTERAFFCKKGCGRTYKTRKNCNAHEKRCDGRGGVLIQRFLDAGQDRPFSCRKGCGRAYKTRRTLRGHEKTCNGSPFVGELVVSTGGGTDASGVATEITTMTVLGAALQSSMEAVMGGGVIQTTVISESVPEAVVTETVVTATKTDFN